MSDLGEISEKGQEMSRRGYSSKVFVVNLDRRSDRMRQVGSTLAALGIEFERVTAVDARTVDLRPHVHWPITWAYHGFHRPLPGNIGCFLSHKAIWSKMVEECIPQALVLEDDAEPIDWDKRILEIDIEEYGLDMLRIGANRAPNDRESLSAHRSGPFGRKLLDAPMGKGTVAYIISNEGARKGLRASKFWFPPDRFDIWSSIYGLRLALIVPLMWTPSGSPSDIAMRRYANQSLESFSRWLGRQMRGLITAAVMRTGWPKALVRHG